MVVVTLFWLVTPVEAQVAFFFCNGNYTVREGSTVAIDVPLVSAGGPAFSGTLVGNTVDVVVTGGSAIRNVDYLLPATTTLPAAGAGVPSGEVGMPGRRFLSVPTVSDSLAEGSETINLALANPQGFLIPFDYSFPNVPLTLATPGLNFPAVGCDSTNFTTATITIVDVPPSFSSTPGLTGNQQAVAAALDVICPTATGALAARCTEIAFLSPADRQAAFQQLAPEEMIIQARTAIEAAVVQRSNLGLRLSALRGGARGISLGGLRLPTDRADEFRRPGAPMVASLDSDTQAVSIDNLLPAKLGVFVNGQGSFGDRDATSNEAGFAFHTKGVTAGVDYRLTDALVVGGAFGYLSTAAEIDHSAGSTDTRTYSVALYGTYYPGTNFYVDAILSYGWNDYDSVRRLTIPVVATTRGDTSGRQFSASASAGYNANFGPLTVGPFVRLDYITVDIDSFTEHGTDEASLLHIRGQDVDSLISVLGVQGAYAISFPFGVVSPTARFEWNHEYLNDARNLTSSLVADPLQTTFRTRSDSPDRDYFHLGAGVTVTAKHGISGFLFYETILGQEHFTSHGFTAGVRVDF